MDWHSVSIWDHSTKELSLTFTVEPKKRNIWQARTDDVIETAVKYIDFLSLSIIEVTLFDTSERT
jgi:hypothetical protein